MKNTTLIPVIHMINVDQVRSNINTCIDNNVNHIFLINHVVDVPDLIDCAYLMRKEFPNLWIGVNLLGYSYQESLNEELPGINGLWIDQTIKDKKRKFKGLVFGGLAFKYQPQPIDVKSACEESKVFTDISCTSGPGTGKAPNIEKIKMLHNYLGNHPIAIASGVSEDNVELYKEYVDYLLVASSITDKNEMIIPEKLIRLKNKI